MSFSIHMNTYIKFYHSYNNIAFVYNICILYIVFEYCIQYIVYGQTKAVKKKLSYSNASSWKRIKQQISKQHFSITRDRHG
jgi:hypothetical protein